jgi:hypothetical protein
MDVTTFLAHLDGVKGRNGSWVARCPAHEDRSPSLTVKELGDGRILMHCFAGCGTDAVLGVLGLSMGDLFPEPLATRMTPVRAFSAADALRALKFESSLVVMAAADTAEGKPVDQARVAVAAGRIAEALEYTCGS